MMTPENNRLLHVDALRGMALFGILIANIPFTPDSTDIFQIRQWALGAPGVEQYLSLAFHLLIDKKFITIFGILFGFGFYIQMRRTLEKEANFERYYLIRMALLLLIGTLHAYLLWFGDIIRYYAICGMFLLLVYHWKPKNIFWLGVVFNVFLTATVFIVNGILGLPDYSYDTAIAGELPITDSWGRYLEINATIDPMVNFLDDSLLTFAFSFGNILLGFWLGRILFFQHPQKFSRQTNLLLIFGPVVGLSASYLFYLVSAGELELTPTLIWLPFIIVGGMVLQSLFYIAAFVKAFNNRFFRKAFMFFVPVGKMALTNYILQTVIYIICFFHASNGLKLFGKLTMAETYALAIVLFAFQAVFSKYWLKYFSQGPLEYLWKKASYKFLKPKNISNSPKVLKSS